jgi:cytochrome d ubiquinol oxidase subunit II
MLSDPTLLAHIWFWLIGCLLILYVILDGFDLGAGILFLGTRDEKRRSVIMGALGYTWHANQTWLVVVGGLLFGAFPLAYGVVLSALYILVSLMLLGFILRAVSFEFMAEAHNKTLWNLAFGGGSLLAALAQGFVLGGVLSGLKITGHTYTGGIWEWLTPFTLFVSVGLACGYVLLGAAYLIIKTEHALQAFCRTLAFVAASFSFVITVGAVVWAWGLNPLLVQKWATWPGWWITAFPAILAFLTFVFLLVNLRAGSSETAPFTLAVLFFAFAFVSLAGSLHPYILPPGLTIEAAASPPLTLKIMLYVMIPLLPLMFLYNAYQYWVFRGKAGEDGYGEE